MSLTFCGICSESGGRADPIVWCPDCGDYLCQTCAEHHRLSKASKHHKTMPIENFLELPKYITDLKLYCEEHNVGFTHYCNQHDVAICPNCLLPDHRECKGVTGIEQTAKNVQSSVAFLQIESGIGETIEYIQKAAREVANNRKFFIKDNTDIEAKMRNKRSEINSHFDKIENQARNRLLVIKNDHESKWKMLESEFKEKEAQMLNMRETMQTIKAHGSQLQVFLGIHEIGKELTKQKKYTCDLYSSTSLDKVNIDLEINTCLVNLENQIPTWGEISVSTKSVPLKVSWSDSRSAQSVTEPLNRSNSESNVYRVLQDFDADKSNDLTVKAGDLLMQLPESPANGDIPWMLCRKLDFKKDLYFDGFVPFNCAKKESFLYQFKWFVGDLSIEEKKRMFSLQDNTKGSFIVSWKKETGQYTLSVKVEGSGEKNVCHYPIHKTGSMHNETFFVKTDTDKVSGKSLEEVIEKLKENDSGLKECLRNPCLRIVDDWVIKWEDIEIGSELSGKFGNYCNNFLGKWNKSVPVRIQSFSIDDSSRYYRAEEMVLTQCHHTNIVKLYGVCSDSAKLYIVTEMAPHGSLNELIKQQDRTFPQLLNFAVQVSSGVLHLEEKQILYNDMTLSHVWVFDDEIVKLADFALALDTKKYEKVVNTQINNLRAAPEVLKSGLFSTKADVWVFGIFLIELTSGKDGIYPGKKSNEVTKLVADGYQHSRPRSCPRELYDLALKCMEKGPERRPTFHFLNSFLDDYYVSIEHYYEEIDDDAPI